MWTCGEDHARVSVKHALSVIISVKMVPHDSGNNLKRLSDRFQNNLIATCGGLCDPQTLHRWTFSFEDSLTMNFTGKLFQLMNHLLHHTS